MGEKRLVPVSRENIEFARVFIGITLTLTIITTILIVMRIWFRIRRPLTILQRSAKLGADDYLIVIAYVGVLTLQSISQSRD